MASIYINRVADGSGLMKHLIANITSSSEKVAPKRLINFEI